MDTLGDEDIISDRQSVTGAYGKKKQIDGVILSEKARARLASESEEIP